MSLDRRRSTQLVIGLTALLVAGSGVAALAGPAAGVAPGADLCVAPGKPVVAATPDGSGAATCPSGRTLAVVAAQEAVRLLDQSVADLQARDAQLAGELAALGSRTAVSLKQAAVPWAVGPGGGFGNSRSVVSCGSGKALSGSVRTSQVGVVQSHVSDGGSSWTFELQATGSSPSAQTFVVCMGPDGGDGGTRPVPGG